MWQISRHENLGKSLQNLGELPRFSCLKNPQLQHLVDTFDLEPYLYPSFWVGVLTIRKSHQSQPTSWPQHFTPNHPRSASLWRRISFFVGRRTQRRFMQGIQVHWKVVPHISSHWKKRVTVFKKGAKKKNKYPKKGSKNSVPLYPLLASVCTVCTTFATYKSITPLKTNICPENWWLEDESSVKNGPFSGDIRSFSGGLTSLKLWASPLKVSPAPRGQESPNHNLLVASPATSWRGCKQYKCSCFF